MVILDLEDGAGDIDRDQAYRNIRAANLDPQATIVRIVGPTDPNFAADLEFVRTTPYTTVMVPKVYADLPAGLDGLNIIAMIETPQAVVNIHKIAEHPQVVALFWGAEDLTMGLGGTHSRHLADEPRTGSYRDTMRVTRALMHIHAAAAGKLTIDAVRAGRLLELSERLAGSGRRGEALDAARSGFAASACIHPKQVDVIRRAYQPDAEQIDWARRVVAEAQHHPGAFQLDGEMIDAPLISQAHRVLDRAESR